MMGFLQNIADFLLLVFYLLTLWPYEIIKSMFFPRKRKDINEEIMFITGAGSGIGRGMAVEFAKHGATVICTDLNEETAAETAKIILDNGNKAYSFKLDVTDREAVYKLGDKIRNEIGDVSMLINNAGIVTGRKFMECSDALMQKTVEVNTISHFWTLKAFLGDMIKKNHGHVVSIASIAGYGGSPQMVDYCASKFGAVGLTEALTVELKYEAPNVKVTSICPWFIKTGMFDGAKSLSPTLLPIMEPEYVVNQIVAGVLNDEKIVFIPKTLMAIVIFKSIAPISLGFKVADFLRLDQQMLNFTGRGQKKTE